MATLGTKLKSLRNERSISMNELADVLNERYNTKINKGMISKWENDIVDPSLENLRTLASFYKVTYR